MEIDAAWVGDRRIFWLWREMGRNRRVSDPFAWQLGRSETGQRKRKAVQAGINEGGRRAWRNILAGRKVLLQGQDTRNPNGDQSSVMVVPASVA